MASLALDILSFSVADVQQVGPLAAVYLTATLSWSKTSTGIMLSAIELTRILCNPLAGVLIDRLVATRRQNLLVVGLFATCATYAVLASVSMPLLVALALIAQGAIACIYGPGINALSLVTVGQDFFADRAVRNENFKHLGMFAASVAPIFLVPWVGYSGFFLALSLMAPVAAAAVLMIRQLDSKSRRMPLARSTSDVDQPDSQPRQVPLARSTSDVDLTSGPADSSTSVSRLSLLRERDALLFLGGIISFHIANAAQLPALGQKIDMLSQEQSSRFILFGLTVDGVVGISLCTIVAQLLMIPAAIGAKWLAAPTQLGLKLTLLLCYLSVPVRAVINALSSDVRVLLAGQVLDAVGGGISVLAVLLLESLSRGTSHFAFLQGVGYTCVGVGAMISNTVAATVIDRAGFGAAFGMLATIAVIPLALTSLLGGPAAQSAMLANRAALRRIGWIGLTVLLLCASCSAMITAWYLHLKFENVSMPLAILASWIIAGSEYLLQVPANRIGSQKAGLSAAQLRGIAELATLVAFLLFQSCVLLRPVLWNHVIGFGIVFCGVLVVLAGPWTSPVCKVHSRKVHTAQLVQSLAEASVESVSERLEASDEFIIKLKGSGGEAL